MKKVNYEQLKTAINAAVANATIEFEYSKEVSDLLGYDPEQTGWFYRKNEEGVLECTVSDGQCNPGRETVEEFLRHYKPISFSSTLTYEEFVDAVKVALELNVTEGAGVVEVTYLNDLLCEHIDPKEFSHVYAKREGGELTVYIDWEDTNGEDPTDFTEEEFLTEWTVSVYHDLIHD